MRNTLRVWPRHLFTVLCCPWRHAQPAPTCAVIGCAGTQGSATEASGREACGPALLPSLLQLANLDLRCVLHCSWTDAALASAAPPRLPCAARRMHAYALPCSAAPPRHLLRPHLPHQRRLSGKLYGLRRSAASTLRDLVTCCRRNQQLLLDAAHAQAYSTLMSTTLPGCGDQPTQVRVCVCLGGPLCMPAAPASKLPAGRRAHGSCSSRRHHRDSSTSAAPD
jgi:hypothetical protein